jgi:tRNA(Ile2)-agmatinylcytidine synthase
VNIGGEIGNTNLHGGFSIYIGIDDTDSVKGMCTTYLASELILEFDEYDVIGYPRLVRLNPNVPWKTRGNGAISLNLGYGSGKRFIIGNIEGKKYYGYENGKSAKIKDMGKRTRKIIEENARFEDKNTNPAYVVMKNKPPQWLYWEAVRDIVDLNDVIRLLKKQKAIFKGYKNKRGLVGASAAISWRPRDRTHEIIVYRERKRWGTKRSISLESVIKMDKSFPSTFNNYDYRNNAIAIAPNSPCPVLFGIRGGKPNDLPKAMDTIESEKKARWILFKTNQGTDEHLQRRRIEKVSKYHSVITSGKVCTIPNTIEGGHVIFAIGNKDNLDCAAYEPTKEFRELIRKLLPGDIVTVYGGVREKPKTVNIEKIRIEKLAESFAKLENPLCPKCGKRMKSWGKGAGFRCPACRVKLKEDEVQRKRVKRDIKEGFYEVPVSARRHLAKPLKRY